MTTFTTPTEHQRQAILFLEVVAYLHDIGKFSDQFLKNLASDWAVNIPKTYNYELRTDILTLFPQLNSDGLSPERLDALVTDAQNPDKSALYKEWPSITALLSQTSLQSWEQRLSDNQAETYNLAELTLFASQWAGNVDWSALISKHMQPAQLVGRLHGAAHYEKKAKQPGSSGGGQPYQNRSMYRSTAFGLESPISGDAVTETLSDLLPQLPLSSLNRIATDERSIWLAEMRHLLQQGVADTRRAINDVTLWDWGYSVANLLKPAVYTIFQSGWPTDLTALTYRTLRINQDILGLYGRSDKISDLLGIRKALDDAYTKSQAFIESNQALGNRFFHDQTGTYYLVPDLGNIESLRNQIQAFFPKDLRPQVHLGKPITIADLDPQASQGSGRIADTVRQAMERRQRQAITNMLIEPRQRALEDIEYPVDSNNNLVLDEIVWQEGRPENAEICTVCGTNPVGFPRESAESERIAQEGYAISDSWATEEKARARNICRTCLIRRSHRSEEWLENKLQGTIWMDEVADNNGRLALLVGSLDLDDWLNGVLLDTLRADIKGTRKMASPARLYRITETGRTFWEEVAEKTTPETIDQRPYRLAIYPENTRLDLGHAYAYELDLGNITLSAVWDKMNRRFLTTENLAYFMKRWPDYQEQFGQEEGSQENSDRESVDQLAILLEGKTITVMEPSEFLKPSQEITEITIARAESLAQYSPQIPLLSEPGMGMLLVPAADALSLAKAIKTKYEAEMGRVLDRLPLHLGIVFFPRRTPITTVLNTGKRLLQMPSSWETWQVEKHSSHEITFTRNGRSFSHTYPMHMGDGLTTDDWYPYLLTVDPTAANVDLTAANAVKHVQMVADGETVYIRPGLFDFVFLDATGRQFTVSYDTSTGKRPLQPTRPFLLADLDRLESLWQNLLHLEVSQRYQVIFAIESTREAWHGRLPEESLNDPVFVGFVRDTLAGAKWNSQTAWASFDSHLKQQLIQAGVEGELADLAELHMEIMKEPR